MVRKLIEEYEMWELIVNIQEMKYLCIGAKAPESDNGRQQGNLKRTCKEYKYLGITLNQEGTND